jgi:anti-anti-sigma regulatory factor
LLGPIVAFGATGSMLRIQRTTDGTITVLTVSGRLDAANIDELRQSLDTVPDGDAVALDLADLLLADRAAVRLLGDREASGQIVLRHCPAYIRRLMESEHIR